MKLFVLLITLLITLNSDTSSTLQHAKIYKDQNVSGWVMSEKLDGIRGYWDGETMYTKQGTKLFPPAEFTANFPPFALDGELWSKRQDFEYIQSTVLKHKGAWTNISYNVFEVPKAKGNFSVRLKKVSQWFQQHPTPHVHIITQHHCYNQTSLLAYLETVVAKGGEGVMVKDPTLTYFQGRTAHILKLKKAHDMEGKVRKIHMNPATHLLKSIELELANGIHFKLGNGFSDEERKQPPSVGQSVTFKYYGLTKNGKPKFASFIRVRSSI